MTTFPGSPRLLKGAIIGLDPTNPLASIVVFQYNPDTMTRRLPARVLPVRVTGFSITEEAYDTLLNPIRAKVDLTLNVLSYVDLKITNPGYTLFLAHQIAKEVLATTNVLNSIQNVGAGAKLF